MAIIVPARIPQDVDRCVDLWIDAVAQRDGAVDAQTVGDRMRRLFDSPVSRFALAGEPLMGFALSAPQRGGAPIAVLERLAVRPSHGGRGIGRALLADAIQSSEADGFDAIELAVRTGNDAVRLYEAAGFRPVSDPVPHPLGGEPMVTYRLSLSSSPAAEPRAPGAALERLVEPHSD